MQHKLPQLCLSVLIAVGSGAALAAGAARTMPDRDPPQWHTEDTTPQMHYQTSKKEAGAAYQEARNECKQMQGADARACNQEARSNYEKDMAAARKMLQR